MRTIFLSILLATSPVISAQQTAEAAPAKSRHALVAERCQKALDALHEKSSFPGGSFALILPDGGEITCTTGHASVEDKQKMKPTDRLCAGSIGKTYVAAALLHAAHAKKLDLDSKVATHLADEPWFERLPNAKSVTVRQLLNHSSGIPRYVFKRGFWKQVLEKPDKVWKPSETIGYVLGDEPLFEAGKGWAYADTNYLVAGLILEKVSGQSMYDYVRRHLLTPHELRDTIAQDRREIPGLVQGYIGMLRQLGCPEHTLEDGKFFVNPQFEWCGGGFVTTPLDLARWARILWTGKAMKSPYLKAALKPVPAERYFGPGSGYGLGVIVRKTKLGRSLGHDGVFPGYASSMAWFPEVRLAAAFQINRDGTRESKVVMHRALVELCSVARKALEK